jgi:hypothetical protein
MFESTTIEQLPCFAIVLTNRSGSPCLITVDRANTTCADNPTFFFANKPLGLQAWEMKWENT